MTYAETILPEFDQELAKTRKVLERVPEDKLRHAVEERGALG